MSSSSDSLAQRIRQRKVAAGSVAAWWLGGSGFIFKTAAGRQVWIDPYLSDSANAMFGLKRAFPPPIAVEESEPDFVLSTHWHEDHLDPGWVAEMAKQRPSAKFLMSPATMAHAVHVGVPIGQVITLTQGQTLELGEIKAKGIAARHEAGVPGWEVPDAIGVLLEFGDLRVYHTGDTDYDPRIHRSLSGTSISFATCCINGSVGNMNVHEAALLMWQIQTRSVMPHHHHIWSRAAEKIPVYETLDPNMFASTYRKLGGTASVLIPEVGRDMLITKDGIAFG